MTAPVGNATDISKLMQQMLDDERLDQKKFVAATAEFKHKEDSVPNGDHTISTNASLSMGTI